MSGSKEIDHEVFRDEIQGVIYSIVDKINHNNENRPREIKNRLDVINKCKDYKEGEENNLGIFSDLEVLADCTCKEVLDNLDHNDYCSKNTTMEDKTKTEDSDLKGDDSQQDSLKVVDENIGDKEISSQEESSQNVSSLDSTIQGKPKSNKTLTTPKVVGITPRATRSSQNPDFAAKHRKFLTSKLMKRDFDSDSSETLTSSTLKNKTYVSKDLTQRNKPQDNSKDNISDIKIVETKVVEKRKREIVPSKVSESDDVEAGHDPSNKKRKNSRNENYQPTVIEGEGDCYCWRCHRDGNVIPCETCPRVYHLRCIQLESVPSRGWVCPECSTVMHAENTDSRSKAMRMLTLDQLCKLLQFAVNRMKAYEGSEEFSKPVDTQQFEHYRKFIVKPMDLSLLEENIKNNLYGSTEAFLADAKWILHNCVIFNTVQSKFTNVARALLKICRQEMLEIENCPDCYQNAHTRSSDSWFIEVCRKPHVLVWAKLKGFPFWPAKAMSTNNENQVDVRFFGAHDRAWVPVSACYLYSKMPPAQSVKKKNNLEECIQELEAHIKKLRDKFGKFEHAPYKTFYNPKKEDEQLSLLLPNFDAKISNSKKVGRLIHDRIRPQSANPSPEKKDQISDLIKEKPETQKEKLDERKSVEKQSNEQKRKAKSYPTPSRGPKVKYLGQVDKVDKKESSDSMMLDIDKQLDDDDMLPSNNDEYDSSSPPKFFISKLGLQKANVKVLSSTSNETKIAFVDKLQEKLSRLENANKELELDKNKNQENSSEESSVKTSDSEMKLSSAGEKKRKDVDKYAEITIIKSVVVLHDLKNSKVLNEKLKNSVKLESDTEVESNEDNLGEKRNEVKTNVTNPTDEVDIIQIDSSPSSVGSNENPDEEREKTNEVNKKKNNINNVVQTIKERKSSTDGKTSDKSVEKDNNLTIDTVTVDKSIIKNDEKNFNKEKQSVPSENTEVTDAIVTSTLNLSNDENEVSSTRPDAEKVMLDDSEYPLVIIDEPAEDNMSSSSSVREIPISCKDSNKILKSCLENSDKPVVDKNRRKGKPAKVCSRESVDSQESNESTRRISVEQDGFRKTVVGNVLDEVSGKFTNNCKSLIDTHISGVLDEVSGKYTGTQNSSEESNVTINFHSDESMLNRKSPKEIRASVNLSKDVSLSVLGDITPSTLDMECISDSEEPVLLDENIPNAQQQVRPTARKTLPKPTNTRMISITKNINKPPPQRKSTELTEGIKVCSPQSLQNVMSPPLLATNDLNKSIPQVHNGHPPVQMMPSRNVPTPRILPPLHKPSGPMGPGPLNVHLDRLAQKLSGRFRIMFEEILKEMSLEGCTEATIKGLQVEMERMQWRHRQEMAELKHNTDLVVMEVRASLESEKQRILIEAKHKFEQEKEMAVQETKRKQWCAYCYKEALLYCCWNTAYCSYPCQQSHWLQHMAVCSQSELPARNDNPKQIIRGNTGPGVLSNSPKAFSMQNQPQMHDVISDYDFEGINNYSHLGHDFDNNNNEDTLIRTKAPRRKRCGECEGCSLVENCQSCRACLNQRSHQVCQKRRCSNIIYHRAANKKRHPGSNSNNMKHGIGDGFVPHNVPIMNNGNRNMGPRHFTHGPPHHFIPMVHHQPPPPGNYHHLPPTDQVFPHPVFMN